MYIMKLTDKAQKTLGALFAGGTGKPSVAGAVFGTTVIYNAGRAAGMKFREIQETFMTDDFKVGYGKYDLSISMFAEVKLVAPKQLAAKKVASKGKQKPLTKEEKYQKMLEASENWEVVYCAETEEAREKAEQMFE